MRKKSEVLVEDNIQPQQFKILKSSILSSASISHFTSNNVDKNNIHLPAYSSISTTSSLPIISSINSAADTNSTSNNFVDFNINNNFDNSNNVDNFKEYIAPSTGDNRAQEKLTTSGPLHKSNNNSNDNSASSILLISYSPSTKK
jgi:hypothetical protein